MSYIRLLVPVLCALALLTSVALADDGDVRVRVQGEGWQGEADADMRWEGELPEGISPAEMEAWARGHAEMDMQMRGERRGRHGWDGAQGWRHGKRGVRGWRGHGGRGHDGCTHWDRDWHQNGCGSVHVHNLGDWGPNRDGWSYGWHYAGWDHDSWPHVRNDGSHVWYTGEFWEQVQVTDAPPAWFDAEWVRYAKGHPEGFTMNAYDSQFYHRGRWGHGCGCSAKHRCGSDCGCKRKCGCGCH
jgi:hypothetical protein